MPRPTRDQRVYMRLMLIAELRDVARKAVAEINEHAEAVARDAAVSDEELQRLWDTTAELHERMVFLGSSARALDLAERSIT